MVGHEDGAIYQDEMIPEPTRYELLKEEIGKRVVNPWVMAAVGVTESTGIMLMAGPELVRFFAQDSLVSKLSVCGLEVVGAAVAVAAAVKLHKHAGPVLAAAASAAIVAGGTMKGVEMYLNNPWGTLEGAGVAMVAGAAGYVDWKLWRWQKNRCHAREKRVRRDTSEDGLGQQQADLNNMYMRNLAGALGLPEVVPGSSTDNALREMAWLNTRSPKVAADVREIIFQRTGGSLGGILDEKLVDDAVKIVMNRTRKAGRIGRAVWRG